MPLHQHPHEHDHQLLHPKPQPGPQPVPQHDLQEDPGQMVFVDVKGIQYPVMVVGPDQFVSGLQVCTVECSGGLRGKCVRYPNGTPKGPPKGSIIPGLQGRREGKTERILVDGPGTGPRQVPLCYAGLHRAVVWKTLANGRGHLSNAVGGVTKGYPPHPILVPTPPPPLTNSSAPCKPMQPSTASPAPNSNA